MKKENISGSEALIHCLLEEGVELIYGYPGGAIMPFYDELYKFCLLYTSDAADE